MSPENDQTKWVGVRPTNPPETIPVGMVGAPPCTPVEPCAAGTRFNTQTQKRTPAVTDLQAPESFVRVADYPHDVGAPSFLQDAYTVPAGKIFKMELMIAQCAQADPTLIEFRLRSGGSDYAFYEAAYGGAWEKHYWTRPLLLDEDEIMRVAWTGTLATTDCHVIVCGHIFDRY